MGDEDLTGRPFAERRAAGAGAGCPDAVPNFIIATLMPEESRTTGMAVAYGPAVAIFGGTASYFLLWAQPHDLLWLFVSYAAALSLISVALYHSALRRGQVLIGN